MDAPKPESFPTDLKEQVAERSALLREMEALKPVPMVKVPEKVR